MQPGWRINPQSSVRVEIGGVLPTFRVARALRLDDAPTPCVRLEAPTWRRLQDLVRPVAPRHVRAARPVLLELVEGSHPMPLVIVVKPSPFLLAVVRQERRGPRRMEQCEPALELPHVDDQLVIAHLSRLAARSARSVAHGTPRRRCRGRAGRARRHDVERLERLTCAAIGPLSKELLKPLARLALHRCRARLDHRLRQSALGEHARKSLRYIRPCRRGRQREFFRHVEVVAVRRVMHHDGRFDADFAPPCGGLLQRDPVRDGRTRGLRGHRGRRHRQAQVHLPHPAIDAPAESVAFSMDPRGRLDLRRIRCREEVHEHVARAPCFGEEQLRLAREVQRGDRGPQHGRQVPLGRADGVAAQIQRCVLRGAVGRIAWLGNAARSPSQIKVFDRDACLPL
mmetsp:Transcript_10884/g.32276  ORF Transcript_10884/g.32276 Transcript_10884/m.32276 type:complete len:398 (-) Transcript_10884:1284-2477(-)